MITRTKHILGIPATQRQSRDRQQRRRQQQQQGRADSGSDEEKPKSRGPAVIRVKKGPKPAADTAAEAHKTLPRPPSAAQRKRRRVDIRI